MKVLITGGAGFIGSALSRKLIENGYEVYSYDLRPSKVCNSIIGDITDVEAVYNAVKQVNYVYHLAAIADLNVARLHPELALKVNVDGTYVVAKCCSDLDMPLSFACHDIQTRIVTINGIKKVDELNIEDKVFTLNKKGIIEVQPIEKIYVYKYNGKMIHFKGRSFNLLVTPNHKMLIRTPSNHIILEDAQKTFTRRVYKIPSGIWNGNKEEKIKIDNKSYDTGDILYLIGIYIGDGYLHPYNLYINKTGLTRKERLVKARDNKGRFIKIQTSDGNKKIFGPSNQINLCIPKSDKAAKKVEGILNRCGIKYSWHKKGAEIYFVSSSFYNLFKECGKGALQKKIPKWCLSYGKEYLEFLFDGLMDSDGYRHRVLTTISPFLAENMVELCIKIGKSTHFHIEKEQVSYINKRRIANNYSTYYVYVHSKERLLGQTFNTAKMVDYNGSIWCLSVPNNNFLVEREGDVTFSGNSTACVFGNTPNHPSTEESICVPTDIYGVTKVVGETIIKGLHEKNGLTYDILRFGTTYGPGLREALAIHIFIRQALENQPLTIHGSGLQTRCMIYIDDLIEGITKVLEKGIADETLNLATEEELSVLQIANMILEQTRCPSDMLKFVPDRPGQIIKEEISMAKTQKLLDWTPQTRFKMGLKKTLEWFQNTY
ncbi:hypothetical protein CH330_01340 [candidate division WOR-3 bacterium JGI_Cruoil_03_51_56]|uniref:DOD-type homing endonuclease domain-containing protein n=1 Tax=candidate division WOR-3 bacterium JGI_Cruoil_03_51_56 TaxID=1973747 RepID=A0A235BX65_UNCW3|nr:MAG: hypothetical protein CH330_01340 [candidate division WOR-3 bacterium JGI_Cruoil_03_51_56]